MGRQSDRTMTVTDSSLLDSGRKALEQETRAMAALGQALGETFASTCRQVLDTQERVILMGVGKSGHVAAKIAATFSSTGTSAQFIHPTEAGHGDLGAIHPDDLVILLSKSGNSKEISDLLPVLKGRGNRLVCFTCEAQSPLATACDLALVLPLEGEACPINLAPTTSTTLMLALGDAIAIAVLNARGFSPEDFARSHPAGALGRRLLIRVKDLMDKGKDLPLVLPDDTIADALMTVSSKKSGAAIVASENRALGVLTDGDLRRCLAREVDIHHTPISEVMTQNFRHIEPDVFATEALALMREHSITLLPVLRDGQLEGAISLHTIIQAGVA